MHDEFSPGIVADILTLMTLVASSVNFGCQTFYIHYCVWYLKAKTDFDELIETLIKCRLVSRLPSCQ